MLQNQTYNERNYDLIQAVALLDCYIKMETPLPHISSLSLSLSFWLSVGPDWENVWEARSSTADDPESTGLSKEAGW